jgi:hypothetical protein
LDLFPGLILNFDLMKTSFLRDKPFRLAAAGLVGAAISVLAPGQAKAANPVTVLSPANVAGIYTVTYLEGAWSDPSIRAALKATPWWSNPALATQVAQGLGGTAVTGTPSPVTVTLPQTILNGGTTSVPAWYLFAYDDPTVFGTPAVQGGFTTPPTYTPASVFTIAQSGTTYSWALGTFQPLPGAGVPGPLPVVGAAAAFGYSRRLRKRINQSASA